MTCRHARDILIAAALAFGVCALVPATALAASCGCRCVGSVAQPYCDEPGLSAPVCPPEACITVTQEPPRNVITPPPPPKRPDPLVRPDPLYREDTFNPRRPPRNPVKERLDKLNRQNKTDCTLAPVRNPATGGYEYRRRCN